MKTSLKRKAEETLERQQT